MLDEPTNFGSFHLIQLSANEKTLNKFRTSVQQPIFNKYTAENGDERMVKRKAIAMIHNS